MLSRHTVRALRWRPLWLAAVSVLLLSGCRTVKEAAVRTEYVKVYQRDSVFVDCTDTLYVEAKGDTVRIREKITEREYHYTVFRDTLRSCDTLRYVEKVTVHRSPEAAQRKVRRWPWFCAGFFSAVLIIFAARILIRIYLKK